MAGGGRRARGTILAAALVLCASAPAEGQECTYAACALRIQGRHIVAGAPATSVTKLPNWSTPDLRPWMAVSDSTERYIGIVEENWSTGAFLRMTGLAAAVVGIVLTRPREAGGDYDSREWAGVGLLAGGIGLTLYGATRSERAQDALATAIWYYNGTLEGGPIDPAAGDVVPPGPPPELAPTDYGRRGAVIGVLTGVAAGLAIMSDTRDVGEGVAGTLAAAAIGGWGGYLIGKAIPR